MKHSSHETSFEHNPRQADLFFENDPELREKYEKCAFTISILGGNASSDSPDTEILAKAIGYQLVKNWYSIQTGGYMFGTMKAALEGGNEALFEMKSDPVDGKTLALFNPVIKGITAETLKPVELAVKGEHIVNEVADGSYDVYVRLGKLIEDSKVCIVLPGSFGTETEVMANLAFGKFKAAFNVPTKPVIFVGNCFDALVQRFVQENAGKADNIFKVSNEQEALELVDLLSKQQRAERDSIDTEEIQMKIDSKLYVQQ